MASLPTPREFLGTLAPFRDWTLDPTLADALKALADRAEVWSYTEGDVVRFPDEAPDGPTWVAEGCLVVLPESGVPRYVGVKEALDVPPGPWVRGQTAGRFVSVPEESWRDWLRAFPAAAQRLGHEPPPGLPRSVTHSPLVLEPGETPVHVFRKSRLFLGRRSLVPAVFFFFFLALGLGLQFGFGGQALAVWFLPGLGMAVCLGLAALVAWEWTASVLVVTDRSVIVRQIDVWAHRSDFEKLALEKIREAVFVKKGLMDTLLRLVTLEVEGDSPKGRLVFEGLARNSRFLTAMEDLRARRVAAAPGRRVIRAALAGRTGGARCPRLDRPADRKPAGSRKKRLSWRSETDKGVWFRRHPWAAAKRVAPWAGWTALVAFLAAVAAGYWPAGGWTVAGVAALVALVPLARAGWEVWDWANDRLGLVGEKIVLVRRRPLGLGEIRQEGLLEGIEQVGVRKDSLAAMVLDFGTVTVGLGNGDPLVFDHAAHAEWVQNEIFHRRTLLGQDRERRAVQARLDEVSEILDTWDEAKKAGYFSEKKGRP